MEVSVGGGFSKQSRDCCIPSKSKTVVSPQSALVVLSPAKSPSGPGAEEVVPGKGGLFPSSSVISPAGWRLGCCRVPQQSASSSPGESLEGDTFYAFII